MALQAVFVVFFDTKANTWDVRRHAKCDGEVMAEIAGNAIVAAVDAGASLEEVLDKYRLMKDRAGPTVKVPVPIVYSGDVG